MVGVHITGLGHGLVDVEGEKNQDSTIQPQEADTLDLSATQRRVRKSTYACLCITIALGPSSATLNPNRS